MKVTFAETTDHIDVGYVAQLARLVLNEDEKASYQSQLDDILTYVAELNELDVTDVPPMAHPLPRNNVIRADELAPSLDRELVLENAPQVRNKQIVVLKIIE